MKTLTMKFVFAAFCLFLLPASALADGVVVGPCGNQVFVGPSSQTFGPCGGAGGGTVSYSALAFAGENAFSMLLTANATGSTGQFNSFVITAEAFPFFTIPNRPVLTILGAFGGTVTILEPGATVDIILTGQLGGTTTTMQHFTQSGLVTPIIFTLQGQSNIAILTVTINIQGAATYSGNSQYRGVLPEPTTLVLLGTGLAGVAVRMGRRRRNKAK